MLKKAICMTLCVLTVTSSALAEDINLPLAELSSRASKAVISYYKSNLNLKISPKAVTDITILTVGDNKIEMSAIAPTPDKNDGIPYYCEITLQRKDADSSYVLTGLGCSKYD